MMRSAFCFFGSDFLAWFWLLGDVFGPFGPGSFDLKPSRMTFSEQLVSSGEFQEIWGVKGEPLSVFGCR